MVSAGASIIPPTYLIQQRLRLCHPPRATPNCFLPPPTQIPYRARELINTKTEADPDKNINTDKDADRGTDRKVEAAPTKVINTEADQNVNTKIEAGQDVNANDEADQTLTTKTEASHGQDLNSAKDVDQDININNAAAQALDTKTKAGKDLNTNYEADEDLESIFNLSAGIVNCGGLISIVLGHYIVGPNQLMEVSAVGFLFFFTVVLGLYLMMVTTVRNAALTLHISQLAFLLMALLMGTLVATLICGVPGSGNDSHA
ncbi:unnamed protein product [Urochloa humidicola]